MPETSWSRRRFLRSSALGALGLIASACTDRPSTAVRSPRSSPTSPSPDGTTPAPLRILRWTKVNAAGPGARRDHTFTGSAAGALLFGGRRDDEPLDDLWIYTGGVWTRLASEGPSPRFGHNAIVAGDALIVFGGQGRGDDFFNDVWRYDLATGRWTELQPRGTAPARRYGASSIARDGDLIVSHGFTFQGRFDDTRALRGGGSPAWRNLTPDGRKPVERCLHRAALLDASDQMLLFGGQTTGEPFLGDTWLFDLPERSWLRIPGDGPPPRNLYALAGIEGKAYLFGGFGPDGPMRDTWHFDGAAWRRLSPAGGAPTARGGIEAAVVDGPSLLTFGGSDGDGELDDLWELSLPNGGSAEGA